MVDLWYVFTHLRPEILEGLEQKLEAGLEPLSPIATAATDDYM